MKKSIKKLVSVVLATSMVFSLMIVAPKQASAENPVIQTTYTADPAPLVVGDTLYLYTTHDELRETKYDDWSYMNDWRCYSTTDMINWTDHGQVLHAHSFDGGTNNWRAWAHQVVEMPIYETSTGDWVKKYFMFAPFNGTKIDVAVADTPTGPFYDATPGKYLIDGGWGGGNIDPTVYIEDHGNPEDYENYDVYMYWGNPYIRYCKLTNDMVDVDPDTDDDGVISSYENSIDPRFSNEDNKILGQVRPGIHSFDTLGDAGYASFGAPSQGANAYQKYPAEPNGSERKRCAFEEGPWVLKHEDGNPETDDYFMYFVGGRTPGETVEYSTAPTPIGPWTYQALLMPREYGSCIHPGFAEFKGKNYIFYLNDRLVGGDGSNRSVCVKEFEYDENNKFVKQTGANETAYILQKLDDPQRGKPYFSVDPVGTLNPYGYNEAETICWTSNLDGAEGGFNGTGRGVKTKAKEQYTEKDIVTGLPAFWQSAYYNGVAVYDIDNNDYIKLREVDFGEREAIAFKADIACGEGLPPVNTTTDNNGMMIPNPDADTVGGTLEVWIDYEDADNAKCIAAIDVSDTGGTNTYETFETEMLEEVTGIHDLFFIFTGEPGKKLFNFDTWQFVQKEPPATPTPVVTPAPEATPVPDIQPTPAAPSKEVKAPAKVKIKSVKKVGKKLKVTWKKANGADGYQIALATKKGGKYKIKLTVKAPKKKGIIKKFALKKKLFVKVRAYALDGDSKVYGKYSKAKKVK